MDAIDTQQNAGLLRFARSVDEVVGEDAYQEALLHTMQHPVEIRNVTAYYQYMIRRFVGKIRRTQRSQDRLTEMYVNGFDSPTLIALAKGRLPVGSHHAYCAKKLHAMVDDNILIRDGHRRCKACNNAASTKRNIAYRARSAACPKVQLPHASISA